MYYQSEINSIKACYTFSSFITLNNGDLLAAARRGDNKDSELEGLDFFISNDEGDNWSEPWEPFKDVYVKFNLKTIRLLRVITTVM